MLNTMLDTSWMMKKFRILFRKERNERKTAVVLGLEFQQDCGSVSASKWGTSPGWVRHQTGTGFCREFQGQMPGSQPLEGRYMPWIFCQPPEGYGKVGQMAQAALDMVEFTRSLARWPWTDSKTSSMACARCYQVIKSKDFMGLGSSELVSMEGRTY